MFVSIILFAMLVSPAPARPAVDGAASLRFVAMDVPASSDFGSGAAGSISTRV
jgi:hypothetical protein